MISRFKVPFSFLLVVLAIAIAFPTAIAFGQDAGGSAAPAAEDDTGGSAAPAAEGDRQGDTGGPSASPAPDPEADAPSAAPTIKSDKEDYPPGGLVTLTGSNWQPGESVRIVVDDDGVDERRWKRDVNVTADDDGNITDQFKLPDWFVADYTVRATGEQSGEARTTFTDAAAFLEGQSNPACTSGKSCAGGWEQQGLSGWKERQEVPLRVRFPSTGQTKIELTFDHFKGSTAGLTDLYNFTATNGVTFTTPVLTADPGGVWKYNFTADVTKVDAVINFKTRLAAGANNFGGNSLQVTEKAAAGGQVQFAKPAPAGSPTDLAVTKTGPTAAGPGDTLTYTLNYKNKSTTDATGAELTDRLPTGPDGKPLLEYVPGSCSGGCIVVGNELIWDLGTVANSTRPASESSGSRTFQVIVPAGATFGTEYVNQAFIRSAHVDAAPADDTSSLKTTVSVNRNTNLAVSAASGTYGGTAQLSATLTSGTASLADKTVNFTLNGSSVGSAKTNTQGVATLPANLGTISAGSYTGAVRASFAGDAGYNNSSGSNNLTVAKANQAIDFPGPLTFKTVGDRPFTVSATATSGLAVAFKSETTSNCTVVDKTVSIGNAGTCTITAEQAGDGNYNQATPVQHSFKIEKANQTIGFTGPTSVTYGDAPFEPGATATSGGAVAYKVLTPGVCAIDSDPKKVRVLSVGTCTVEASQTGNANYNDATATRDITISKKELTGVFTASDKIYDGNASATIASRSVNGAVPGDAVTLTGGTAAFENKNVGPARTVTATGFGLSGAQANNYSLGAGPWTAQAAITPKPLTGSFTAADKVYDGTTDATIATSNLNGKIANDDVALSGSTARFADKNAGTGKTVTVSGGGLSGVDAGNYNLAQGPWTTTANITERDLRVSAAGVNRVYNGTTNATVTLSTDKLGGDAVTADYTNASFGDKNVGTGKSVSVTGISILGADAGNYDLTNKGASTTASITKAVLKVDADPITKTYDGTNPTNLTWTPSDFVSGEDAGNVAISGDASCSIVNNAGPNAGTYAEAITCAPGNLSSANYDFQTGSKGTLTIDKATLTVAADDKSREYGETNPDLTATITGYKNGETLATSGVAGQPNLSTPADRQSPVADSPYVIAADVGSLESGNYSFDFQNGRLTIGKADLMVTADDDSREYGEANPELSGNIAGAKNGGDNITASYSTAATAASNVGTYAIEPSLDDPNSRLANYNVTRNNGTLTVNKADLTVTTENKEKAYGDANPTFTGSLAGLKNNDDITATRGSTATASSGVGAYDITATLNDPGSKLGNYAVTNTKGTLRVTPAPLTVTANDKTKTYGDANPTLTGNIEGVKNNDNISASYSTAATAASKVGTYAIEPSIDADPASKLANYEVSKTNGTLTVGKATLTVTADNKSRTYGDTNPEFTATYSGFKNDETLASSDVAGDPSLTTPADRQSPVANSPYAINAAVGSLDSGNYSFDFQPGELTINKRPITVTADAKSKTYGADDPALTYQVTSDNKLVGNDGFTGDLTRRGGESVEGGPYAITRGDLSAGPNYELTFRAGTLAINKRPITVTADTDQGKVYGDPDPALTYSLTDGSVASADTLGGILTGGLSRVDGRNVGSYAIQPGDLAANSNYDLTVVVEGRNFAIAQRPITVTGVADTKVYDGTTRSDETPTIAPADGIVGGDAPEFSQAFTDENVGANRTLRPSGSVSDGNEGRNYNVTFNDTGGAITAKEITGSFTAQDKEYDGNTSATVLSRSLNGVLSPDDQRDAVSLDGGNATFANKNAGNGKVVTLTGASLDGADAGNYDLTSVDTASANITVKGLTVGAAGINKTYDGNANATVNLSTNKLEGDQVSAAYAGAAFANKNVGENKAVSVNGISVSGDDAANYRLTNTTANTTANIAKREITVSAVRDTKVYNGTTGSNGTPQVTAGELAGGDTGNFGQAFASKGAGTGKTLIPSGSVADGNDGANYRVTFANGTNGTITPLGITGSFTTSNKVYDGNTDAAAANRALDGQVSGDAVSLSGGTAAFANKDVGTNKTVTLTGATLAGADKDNYNLTSVGTATANITAREITGVFTAANKVYDGNTDATIVDRTLNGTVSGDAVSLSGGTATFGTADAGTSKTVTGTGFGLSGSATGNYKLASATLTTNANINKAPLTITANNATKIYGDQNPGFTVSYGDFVLGQDKSALSGTLAFDTRATAASPVGTYAITPKGLTSGNYNLSFRDGTLTVNKADLTVTTENKEKAYGDANPAFTGSLAGLKNNDDITATRGSTATASSGVGAYDITATLNDPGSKLGNYAVTNTKGTLTITKAPLTVTANDKTKTYGRALSAGDFSGTLTGVKNNDAVTAGYSSEGAAATSGVNTYPIVPRVNATDAVLANYRQPQLNNGTLTVGKATLTVKADDKSRTYGEANPQFTGNLAGLQNNDGITASYGTDATASSPVKAGGYAIVPSLGDPNDRLANYEVSKTNGTLTVGKATLTVTADNKSKTYGDTNPALTATYSGWKNGDTASVLSGAPALGTTASASSKAGTYPITAAVGALAANNYSFAFGDGTLTVKRRDANVVYTGQNYATIASAGDATINLSAKVSRLPNDNLGELTNANVQFTIKQFGGAVVATKTAAVDTNGSTEPTTALVKNSDDPYTVEVRVDPANEYWRSGVDVGSLQVIVGSGTGRTAGGGWIPDDANKINGRSNFGFTVANSKTGLRGNSLFIYRLLEGNDQVQYVVKSNSWQGGNLTFNVNNDPAKATFTGKATVQRYVNGVFDTTFSGGNYTFTVDNFDGDLMTPRVTDAYAIVIRNSSGTIVKQLGSRASPVTMGGGNVLIQATR